MEPALALLDDAEDPAARKSPCYEHGSNDNVPGSGTRFDDVDGGSEFVNAIGRAVDEGIMEPCR